MTIVEYHRGHCDIVIDAYIGGDDYIAVGIITIVVVVEVVIAVAARIDL